MDRSKLTLILLIIAVVTAALLYRQYTLYRAADVDPGTAVAPGEDVVETDGVKHSIPLNKIVSGGPPKDGIPSIDDPKFETVAVADQYLDDNGFGLAVEANGRYRFYPYQILVWHEIVNDTFAGKDLLVTYCPLCFTGIVFDREVNGEAVEFGTSGKLYNSNLLMYDRKSDSLWSQAIGEAVVGELTGSELEVYPSLTISWSDFKKKANSGAFSKPEVLSRNTGISRDYTRDPYGSYYTDNSVWFPLSNEDGRLGSKEVIFGYDAGDAQKAWPLQQLREQSLNDEVGDVPLWIVYDDDLDTLRAYKRVVDGQTIQIDSEDWGFDGRAISGTYKGTQLEVVPLENHFWFSWAASHPNTDVYTIE